MFILNPEGSLYYLAYGTAFGTLTDAYGTTRLFAPSHYWLGALGNKVPNHSLGALGNEGILTKSTNSITTSTKLPLGAKWLLPARTAYGTLTEALRLPRLADLGKRTSREIMPRRGHFRLVLMTCYRFAG